MTFDTEAIKRNTDLLALIGRDTTLRRVTNTKGGEWAGPCPFCGAEDRFNVWPNADRPGWWCRQCERQGDVIAYVRQRDMEIRNQVFGLVRRLFAPQETPKATVGLLRQEKNLVSL